MITSKQAMAMTMTIRESQIMYTFRTSSHVNSSPFFGSIILPSLCVEDCSTNACRAHVSNRRKNKEQKTNLFRIDIRCSGCSTDERDQLSAVAFDYLAADTADNGRVGVMGIRHFFRQFLERRETDWTIWQGLLRLRCSS